MVVLSAFFYFLAYHPFWAWPMFLLLGAALGTLMARWRGNGWLFGLLLLAFIYGQLNIFVGHIVNALFLNAVGERGSAVIVQSNQTNSTLNDSPVYEYFAVMRTADGRDVKIGFDTMSASTYPIRNAILIPPQGARFVVKYVPGFERNVAIMVDESDYGRARLLAEHREPLDRAARQLALSPRNAEFIAEYQREAATFLRRHRADIDADEVRRLERAAAGEGRQ